MLSQITVQREHDKFVESGGETAVRVVIDSSQIETITPNQVNFPASQTVSGTVTVSNPTANPETGLATSAKQTILESLIDTLQELVQRLAPLGGAISSGTTALRVAPISSVSTAVTGTFYQATQPISQVLIGSHTANVIATAQNNLLAVIGNVNNCVGI
jgi:hypothetical protein